MHLLSKKWSEREDPNAYVVFFDDLFIVVLNPIKT